MCITSVYKVYNGFLTTKTLYSHGFHNFRLKKHFVFLRIFNGVTKIFKFMKKGLI